MHNFFFFFFILKHEINKKNSICVFFVAGQPKRHLLTTGWSVFVSAKRLVAGDSVIFIWSALILVACYHFFLLLDVMSNEFIKVRQAFISFCFH